MRRPLRKTPKALNRAIKAIVRRQMETKMNQDTPSAKNIFNFITNTEVFSLFPVISQGTGQASRVGNKISPTYFQLKLAIIAANMNGVYVGASSTYFDIYIFKWKGANQEGGQPASSDMTQFLQDDNSAQSYDGQILDGLRPVNSDMFTLLKKKRITLNNIFNTTVGQMAGYYQSVSPQRTLTFNLTKYLKKTLIYDDNNTNVINDNMYIAIGGTQTDGTNVTTSVMGSYQFFTNLKYKDA